MRETLHLKLEMLLQYAFKNITNLHKKGLISNSLFTGTMIYPQYNNIGKYDDLVFGTFQNVKWYPQIIDINEM